MSHQDHPNSKAAYPVELQDAAREVERERLFRVDDSIHGFNVNLSLFSPLSMVARILQSKKQPIPKKPFITIVATVWGHKQQGMEKTFPCPFSSRPPHFCTTAIWAVDALLLP
jgi:hypothetical protein